MSLKKDLETIAALPEPSRRNNAEWEEADRREWIRENMERVDPRVDAMLGKRSEWARLGECIEAMEKAGSKPPYAVIRGRNGVVVMEMQKYLDSGKRVDTRKDWERTRDECS
jgi:hypothetical protein